MRTKIGAACIAASLLTVPLASQASLVTFSFDATIAAQGGGPNFTWPSVLNVGNPLGMDVTFDPNATFLRTRNDGNGNATIFDFSGASISMTARGNGFTNTVNYATFGDGVIRLRDDALDPDGYGDLVDGLTFTLTNVRDPNVVTNWSITLRGPRLDLFNGPQLPATQDPSWVNLRGAQVAICRSTWGHAGECDQGYVIARMNASAPVPEPASAALALLGLGLVGLSRRTVTGRSPGLRPA